MKYLISLLLIWVLFCVAYISHLIIQKKFPDLSNCYESELVTVTDLETAGHSTSFLLELSNGQKVLGRYQPIGKMVCPNGKDK